MLIHTYVIRIDAGSAPNYAPPMVTLAICKPRIRKRADVGDAVVAFAGKDVNPVDPHAVVWAGVVAKKIPFAEYWFDSRFRDKRPDRSDLSDNIYCPSSGGLHWVPNKVHGPEHSDRDLGGSFVLAFNPAWHFGGNGPNVPAHFGLRITGGRRGERRVEQTEAAWLRLLSWLKENAPSHSPRISSERCRPKIRKAIEVKRPKKITRC
jgi:hypothetical protein